MMMNGTSGSWLAFNWTQLNDDDDVILIRTTMAGVDGVNESTAIGDVIVDWDDWDLSLWTPEQRQLLQRGVIPRHVHITLGILLTLVVLFGVAANSTILYVFSRFKRLRTPANVFIINLTICDFFACCLHPLAVYSAFRGRWSFGQTGCNLYGMGVAFFGLNSIVTLSAIACERYIVITSSSCRPAVAKWRITRRQAQKACVGIWLHCAALVSPPLLFGWSTYLPEGVLVTCSWDYTSRTLSNRLYYFYLLFFGFVLPVSVLTFCYVAIFRFIVRSSREMTRLIMTSDGRMSFSKTTVSFRKRRRQTDVRTALIILSLAMLCYTAWTPYAIVSLIGQFGPVDENGQPRKLSPMATAIPAFLAKTAIVFDPLVYGFSHPQFRSSVRQILRQHSVDSSGANGGGVRAGPNNTTMIVMRRPGTGTGRNCHSPRASSNVVFSSLSRSIRINNNTASVVNNKETTTTMTMTTMTTPTNRKLSSNDPSASTSLASQQQYHSSQSSQFRFPIHPDTAGNIQQLRQSESLRKSCMNKRNNSLTIPVGVGDGKRSGRRRKGSGGGGGSTSNSGNYQSLSAADEVSIANSSSLRLMMLQEESEFHLFRQQQTTAGKLQRAAKRERMIQLLSNGVNAAVRPTTATTTGTTPKRRSSEPDLMRCSVRIIPDAPHLSWEEYRRKRAQYIRSLFFRSAGNLLTSSSSSSSSSSEAKGFSEYPILLLTAGDETCPQDNKNKKINPKKKTKMSSSDKISPSVIGPSVVRKLSMTVQSVDRFQAINNRLSEKLHQLDNNARQKRSNSTASSTLSTSLCPPPPPSTGRRRSSSSLLSVVGQQQQQQPFNRSNSLSTHRYNQERSRRRFSSSPIHDECCECAYLPLSQTVTLVKVQSTSVTPSVDESNSNRRPHWRACMVSGRDSLSCSLNSP